VVQDAIHKALVTINDTALRTIEDGSRFFIVEPLNRIKPDWYAINLDNTIKIFENQFESVCSAPNVWRIHASPMLEQRFTQDGVHLTKEAGRTFISTILRNVEASISSTNVAAGLAGSPDLTRPPPTSFQFAADVLRKRDATASAESNTKKRKFDTPWALKTGKKWRVMRLQEVAFWSQPVFWIRCSPTSGPTKPELIN
jgi:hypothetical protein